VLLKEVLGSCAFHEAKTCKSIHPFRQSQAWECCPTWNNTRTEKHTNRQSETAAAAHLWFKMIVEWRG
jgi:hypothetical protein